MKAILLGARLLAAAREHQRQFLLRAGQTW